jgi:hypothetical protein
VAIVLAASAHAAYPARVPLQPAERHEFTVFYAWQSDHPKECRNFIEQALRKAIKELAAEPDAKVVPRLDKDTEGVPGSPSISDTIFRKIDAASVFVGDITPILQTETRRSPNPNVLLELGYAVKRLGWDRVILVSNIAFAPLEELPFDLRGRRTIGYKRTAGTTDAPVGERKALVGKLLVALQAAAAIEQADDSTRSPSAQDRLVTGVREASPEVRILVDEYMDGLLSELDELAPDRALDIEMLEARLDLAGGQLAGFSEICRYIAVTDHTDAALRIMSGFGRVLERHAPPRGFVDSTAPKRFDFFKLVGLEAFLIFVGWLVAEGRWSILGRVLTTDLHVANYNEGSPMTVSFDALSTDVATVREAGEQRRLLSPVGALLKKRHEHGGSLAGSPSFEHLAGADQFLALRSFIDGHQPHVFYHRWYARTTDVLGDIPRFLREAQRFEMASELLEGLGAFSVDALRNLVGQHLDAQRSASQDLFNRSAIYRFKAASIGTR